MRRRRVTWRRVALAVGGVALGGYVGHDVGLRISYAARPPSGLILLEGLGRGVDAWLGAIVGALVAGALAWILAGGTAPAERQS